MHTQEEIENSMLELNESLQKLYKNKDFKKLILDGYLDIGSTNLVKNMSKIKPEFEDDIIAEMKARSLFWRYLDNIEEDARSVMESRVI